jgi:hypothetical protein
VTRKSYWGTLRPGTASYRVFAKQMANAPVACGAKTARHGKVKEQGVREASASRPASGQSVTGGEQ